MKLTSFFFAILFSLIPLASAQLIPFAFWNQPGSECPANYVLVPKNTDYVADDFCIMKYEAKAETNGGGSFDADGLSVVLANYKPASNPTNLPWRQINRDDARSECQSLGPGYDLISNAQWQTVARNLELVGANWTTGTVGSGCMFQGNSGSATCGYNGSDPISSSSNARGIFTLSNGKTLFDFAGNVREWARDDGSANYGANAYFAAITTGTHTGTGTLFDGVTRAAKAQFGPAGSYSTSNHNSGLGFGTFVTGTNGVKRGGQYDDISLSGVFRTSLGSTIEATATLGFRCIYADITPNTINWVDFSNNSSTETISGVADILELELSAVYGTGTPTIEYQINGGSWVAFTPGSPATIRISNNNTLGFQVSGTDSHSATITVKNTNDGNTVLDSVVGLVSDPCPGGAVVNGQCWQLGAVGESCNTVCANATGFTGVHSDTTNYAGSAGSTANCETVLDAFPVTGAAAVSTAVNARSCQYRPSNGNRRRGTDTTTYNASNANWQRACACVATSDVTPRSIDWADFNDKSSPQTFEDFSGPITIRLSGTNGTGSPNFFYALNGGSNIAFSTGSPADVAISPGDTIEFAVTGTVSHTATFTVLNITDGSATIDTVTATVADLCYGGPALGTTCTFGGLYAGEYLGKKYMITPGGCNSSSTPTCPGTTDSIGFDWKGSSGTDFDVSDLENISSVTSPSTTLGDWNTTTLVNSIFISSDSAADFCENMTYATYTDWYLPSKSEMAYIYCHANVSAHDPSNPDEQANCGGSLGTKTYDLPDFLAGYYWTSTEKDSDEAHAIHMNNGNQLITTKGTNRRVRCVRRF